MAPRIALLLALAAVVAAPAPSTAAPTAAPAPATGAPAATTAPATPPTPPPTARARPKEEETARLVEQAKGYFASGNVHYAAGRYAEAIRHFQAGYALVPRPNFLVNLGQAYRKVGDLGRAKESYLAYVRALPQDSPLRDQALQVLAEIEVQLQERSPDEAPTPVASNPPAASTAAPVAPLPPVAVASEPPPRRSRVWPWVVGGGGLALAGAGLFFELRAASAGDRLTNLTREGGFYDPALEERGRRDQRIGAGLLIGGGLALGAAAAMMLFMNDSPVGTSAERAGTSPRARARRRLALAGQGLGVELRF